jgi:hypothetical protein
MADFLGLADRSVVFFSRLNMLRTG